MMRRLVLAVVTLAAASAAAFGQSGSLASASTNQTSAPLLTLLLAHSAWTAVDDQCQPLPGIVDLGSQASEYAARHLTVTASVVTSWVAPATRTCIAHYPLNPSPKPLLISSWSDLSSLQADFGWKFISQGRWYTDVASLPPWQQDREVCGSLHDLQARGFPEAAGLFAYPNNEYDLSVQRQTVNRCYDFGRIYGASFNLQSNMGPPWFARTFSFNGGRCNDARIACSALATRFRYGSPDVLAKYLNPSAGQWSIVQLYRFATGANTTGSTLRWDCTSPDWHDHWTNNTELYCWSDFLSALDRIGPAVVSIDPAGVAATRGRSPGT
jgi:hypothetical protein